MKSSRSEFLDVRGLRYHLRQWGEPGMPVLFMLHGWMDVSASFQFLVDELQRDWYVIAPDWRGFGLTQYPATDAYWIPDYLGDLDAILHHYSPERAVTLVGHSMGGNVASLYAGTRPERVRKLVNLEGFGLREIAASKAPARYARWLEELRQPQQLAPYASQADVARRLQKNNSHLTDARAAFLSQHWAAPDAQGQWTILGDPAHKRINPVLHRLDEMEAFWRAIRAPVLCVEAQESSLWQWFGEKGGAREEIDRRIAWLADARFLMVADAGHMVHHDQPALLAKAIEDFLA
ncbi:alpha/beta hydrolase [Herbaspirillum sp. RTI4]|uniref:alpha/beta fold hydrolase n=1 Tax=Herbaspirillum sp. RTI4 TaxID=3048640 RepID=UPI002AB39752|nr:alpha/beta hydrolase [Herbaspirillum sp. RTI4]MDY7578049.1 alpha/beta hydrolase [Herbaspirillum sp. RTI4]MEA9983179.1 alpha/beta hydrolase [Herbaspirillum sp. RTI4]